MSNLNLWDHVFASVVFVIYPSYARLTVKQSLALLRDGGEAARIGVYQHIIASWILFAACLLGLWIWLQRDWSTLGFTMADPIKTLIAFGVAAAFIALFVVPIRNIAKSPQEKGHELVEQLGDLALFMPETKKEENWFKAVSLNAGITEELIFRGYMLWYLQHFMPLLWAAVIATIAFGIAHAYQGMKQLPGILLVSAVAVGLFIYTGSLLVPVLFHIFLDALQGHYIASVRRGISKTAGSK